MIASALAVTAIGYAPVAAVQLPRHWPAGKVIGSVVVLAVLCTAIAFLVFFELIAEVGPVRATVITYLNPAVAVTLGVLLLHERFTVGIAVGFAAGTGRVGAGHPTLPAVPRPRHRPAPRPRPASPASAQVAG